jgi:hypothetical protein
LREAFTRYRRAHGTVEPRARAQLVLLANLQIGLHEQTRLQPEIAEALDAALLDVQAARQRIVERFDGLLRPARQSDVGAHLLNAIADRLAIEVRAVVREVITERLMAIGLADERAVALGTDLGRPFPENLSVADNPDLVLLLSRYDATPDSTRGSGAVDWAVLEERMHFIADFFRAYQDDAGLFDSPFPSEQLAMIDAGQVPGGV